MKLLKGFSIVALLLVIGLVSCKTSSTKDLIVNKWTLKEFSPNPELQIPDSIKKKLEGNLTLEYTADNKFIQSGAGISQTGTYELSEDGKRITYTIQSVNENFVDSILEISKNKLSILEETGGRKTYNK